MSVILIESVGCDNDEGIRDIDTTLKALESLRHQHGTNMAVHLDKFDLLVSRLAQFGHIVSQTELIRRLKDSITEDTYKAVKTLINQRNLPGQAPLSYWEQRNMFLQQCYEEYPQFNAHSRTSLKQLSLKSSTGNKGGNTGGKKWRCPIHQTDAHSFRDCNTYKQMQAKLKQAERDGKQQNQRRNNSGDKGIDKDKDIICHYCKKPQTQGRPGENGQAQERPAAGHCRCLEE